MSANYELAVPSVGAVKVQKKRGMRSIRLRVTPKGELVVSAPWYVSRPLIERFLNERIEWMQLHGGKHQTLYYDGMHFGRCMQLAILPGKIKNRSKIFSSRLEIYLSDAFDSTNSEQQRFIEQRMIKALQLEAEQFLLPRLLEVSTRIGIPFNQAYIKNLTGRWGSCDHDKNIILSLFLVQLPEALVDYVIIHELAHTKHLNHSSYFWQEVAEHCPNYKLLRKNLKEQSPRVIERV